jgi:hypothetical protein
MHTILVLVLAAAVAAFVAFLAADRFSFGSGVS